MLHFPTEPVLQDPYGSQPPFQFGSIVPSTAPTTGTVTSSSGSMTFQDFLRALEGAVVGAVAGGPQNAGMGAASAGAQAAIDPNYFQNLWASTSQGITGFALDVGVFIIGLILIAIGVNAVIKS